MNVTLNIENDAELRAYIKDCIKGQVLSIVREEFVAIVKEEIERKIKGSGEKLFERMLKEAVFEVIARDRGELIKPYIETAIKDAIAGKVWTGK